MRHRISLVAASGLLAVTASSLVFGHSDVAADATRPENDRIVQLERKIADLEQRLSQLESRQGVRPAVQYVPTPLPQTATIAPGVPLATPVPVPTPDPNEREINGVKYRLFLLGGETPVRR